MDCELSDQQKEQIQKNFVDYCDFVLATKGPVLIATTSDLENKLHGEMFTEALVNRALSSNLYLNKRAKVDEEFGAKVYGYDSQTIAILYEISDPRPLQQDAKAMSDIKELIEKYKIDGVVASLGIAPMELPFRVKWIDRITGLGCNYGHGPGLSTEILRDGFSKIDFKELFRQSETILDAVSEESVVAYHVVSENGTNFVMYRDPMAKWQSDTRLTKQDVGGTIFGEIGNLPPGEVYLEWEQPIILEKMPEAVRVNFPIKSYGTWVCDVSLGGVLRDLRATNTTVTLELGLRDGMPEYSLLGKLTDLQSNDSLLKQEIRAQLEECPDKHKEVNQSVQIYSQELGIGLLDLNEITGNLLLDEKHLGAHMAVGKYFSHVDFLQSPEGLQIYTIKLADAGKQIERSQLEKELMNLETALEKGLITKQLIMKNGYLC